MKSRNGQRWTMAEIEQLGKVPDSVLAKRWGRTIKSVAGMRESRRILFRQPRRRWTAREIRLLGKWSDCELARRLARSRSDVHCQRLALHIPPLVRRPKFKAWTPAEEKLVGRVPDEEIARKFKRTLESVKVHRGKLGIPVFAPKRRNWTP